MQWTSRRRASEAKNVYRLLRWIGYFVSNRICGFGVHFRGHIGGGRSQAVLDILEVTGRVSGRGCLHENTFLDKKLCEN